MKSLITAGMLALAIFGQATRGSAQTQDFTGAGVQERPRTSIKAIETFLNESIETKDFQEERSLEETLAILEKKLTSKKKDVWLKVDTHAFKKEVPELDVMATRVGLQPYPKRMTVGMVLRVLAGRITPPHTYRLSRGQITLTTVDSAHYRPHLDASVTGAFKNVPLARVLEDFSDQTGVAIIVDRRIRRQARSPVTVRSLNGMRLETAMRLLTDMTELTYVAVGNTLYVTSPNNARKFARREVRGSEQFQDATNHSSGHFKNRSLEEILEALTDNVIIDCRVRQQAQQPLTVWFPNDVNAASALSMLTDMLDLAWLPIKDAIYITSPANARKLEKELRTENKETKERLRRDVIDSRTPEQIGKSCRKLFTHYGRDGLQPLADDPDTSIALQALWEMHNKAVKRKQPIPERTEWVFDRESIGRFLQKFARRAGTEPPRWWSAILRNGEVHLGRHHAFDWDESRARTPLMTFQGDRVTISDGKRSVTVGKDLFPFEFIVEPAALSLGIDESLVLFSFGGDYKLTCVSTKSGKQCWSADVWGVQREFTSTPTFSDWEIRRRGETVIVFAAQSYGLHVQAFDSHTGRNLFRFCTSYWSNHSERWGLK